MASFPLLPCVGFASLFSSVAMSVVVSLFSSAVVSPVARASAQPVELGTEEFRSLRCTAHGTGTVYFAGEGEIHARGGEGVDGLLFRVVGVDIARCLQDVEGRWWLLSRELTFYLDPVTREVLHRWTNPVTKESLPVMHNANPYQAMPLAPRIAAVRDGGVTTLALDIRSRIPNPEFGRPKFADHLPWPVFDSFESYAFTFVKGSKGEGSKAHLRFNRVGPWLPWMKLGNRAGDLIYTLTAYKTESYDALPTVLRDAMEMRVPLYQEAPTCILQGQATNSWMLFPQRFHSYLAGETFPLPAPLASDACTLQRN